jgi:glycosyltransferase involved in cell wall biosynthesis
MNRPSVSAIVITKNEEKNIERCLSGLSWADEIIVVDSESTDRTIELARKFTSHIFIRPWPGYSRQKNFAIDKASCEWVLSVDCDEIVEERLKQEILEILSGPRLYSGFYIPRKNFIGNRWVRFGGWYPDYTLRLFKKGESRFEKRYVHEAVAVIGKKGCLKTPLLHYTYQDLRDYAERQLRYARLAAKQMHENGKKASILDLIFRPFYHFIKCYFFRLGFLDGYLGLRLSVLSSNYVFKKYAYAGKQEFLK